MKVREWIYIIVNQAIKDLIKIGFKDKTEKFGSCVLELTK